MLLMRMLKQNHIKLVIILFLNDELQTNLYLYIRNNDMQISPYIGGHRIVLHSLFQNVYSLSFYMWYKYDVKYQIVLLSG
jgi:membrane-bound metal-dependent hydrolase YbcI (DUF457 family)